MPESPKQIIKLYAPRPVPKARTSGEDPKEFFRRASAVLREQRDTAEPTSNTPQTRSSEGIGHLRTALSLAEPYRRFEGLFTPVVVGGKSEASSTPNALAISGSSLVFVREYILQLNLQPTQDRLQLVQRDMVLASFNAVERGV
jgi:hypothetical protein